MAHAFFPNSFLGNFHLLNKLGNFMDFFLVKAEKASLGISPFAIAAWYWADHLPVPPTQCHQNF